MIEQAIQDLTAAILEQTKVLRSLGAAAVAVAEIPPAPEGMAPHMKAERDAIAAAEKEAKAREKAEKAAAKAEKEAAEKAEKEAAEAAAKAAEEAKAAEQAAKDASPYDIATIQKALMKIAAKGKKPEAKAIIQKYGAQSTAGLPASAYADVVADIAALDIDVWTEMFGGNEEEF